jgi:benzoate-CoA ligase
VNALEHLPDRLNAAEHFVDRHVAEGRGGSVAYLLDDRNLTYAELQDLVDRTGNALKELGLGPGDRVLMVCHDAPEFLGTFFGAIKLGAIPVPVNTLLRPEEYDHYLGDSGARVAVISWPLLAQTAAALERAKASALEHVLVAGADAGPYLSFDERITRASARLAAHPTHRDDPAFWLYTSGSTGLPKAAVHRQRDMIVCTETYGRHILGLQASDRIYSASKLFFAYGLGNTSYFPLDVGAQGVLVPRPPTPRRVFEAIARHRPTIFCGVPTLYAALLASEECRRADASSLRLCISAGEALPAAIFERWRERFGVEILDGIGTTEILHIFISNRPGQTRPGSSGKPVPGYEVAIVDDDGRPVERGAMGNLRVRGESTMALYWNDPNRTREVLQEGWIATGDRYREDEDGFFWFCGRGDDMLKVGGAWISPVEVEAALLRHPAVLEAAVAGKEDSDRLTKPKAFVVLKEPSKAGDALYIELLSLVRAQIGAAKLPRWIDFVPSLPKTSNGKIQRFKLRG